MLNGCIFDDTEGNITYIANEGRSLVDYIIASSNLFDKFSYFVVDNHDFADHFPLTYSLQLNNISHETDAYDDKDTASKWGKYKWKESLKQEFLDKFRFHYTHFMNRFMNINQNNIAQSLQGLVNIFQEPGKSMKTSFPNKISSFMHAQPEWWDQSCADRKSRKKHALRKFKKRNSNTDFREYKIERNHCKSLCKIKKKQHQKKRRKILTDSSNKPKDFWTVIKSGKSKNSPENNISNSDWVSYFQSLFSSEVNQPNIDQNHPLQDIVQNNDETSIESQITDAEIRYALSKLKADRSGGPDGLCVEMFKAVVDDIMPFLSVLFNDIFNSGIFPEDWCESIISPIHKSGPINKTENYRDIALINCLCKLFMNII